MKSQPAIRAAQAGFTLIEMMISVAIFVIICGASFGLLASNQRRNQTEAQMADSFEEARLGLDQIVRDVSDAGYPPANQFALLPVVTNYAQTPVAWSPGPYPNTPCTIGVTCVTPSAFDVVFEEDYDHSGVVRWVRYQLVGTTLMRGVLAKPVGLDPVAAFVAGTMVPYIRNVMNNATPVQIGQIQALYPAMFPGGNPVPVFNYTLDSTAGAVGCAFAVNSPCNVRNVQITLIVQARNPDATSGNLRLVELNGLGQRMNPNH